MNIVFGEEVKSCRKITCGSGYFKPGDFTWWQGEIVKVEAVQRECFRLENLSQFVMVTLQKKNGELVLLGN
jgi:hypothetical protein